MNVLLIEDDISTQYLSAQVLHTLDHEVGAFTDAEKQKRHPQPSRQRPLWGRKNSRS
jgi:hypothetical protein